MSDESRKRTVTREVLYEQVWARPLRTVAAEYGLSDVGLAKICTRLNVPRPPVGHWVRLQHGKPVERPPLPPETPGQPTTATIEPTSSRAARPAAAGAPEPEPPTVVVAERLSKPHPAVQVLMRELRDCRPDEWGILVVRGTYGAAFRTSNAARGRALRILDALFKVLERRGHEVTATLEERYAHYRGRLRMTATVNGQKVDVSIAEKLTQREHEPTKDERRFHPPRFDYLPSGTLVLYVGPRYGRQAAQHTWKDSEKKRLEDLLGRIVLAFEAAAENMIREHEEYVRRERAYAEHKRLQAVEQAKIDHQKVLATDLADMANAWGTAKRISEFLGALEDRLPADARTEGTSAWLAWAHQHVAAIDPLRVPEKVAKRLEPDLAKLGLAPL
jgi:hypothetical protein